MSYNWLMRQPAQKSCNFLLWWHTLSTLAPFPVGNNFVHIGIMVGNESMTGMVGRHVHND
jgi:hypothetical protein